MFRPRVIPVLLLHAGGLAKTKGFDTPVYVGDPMNAVKIFNDLEADELVLLDIDATAEGRTIPLDLVSRIGDESYIPFAVGLTITGLEHEAHVVIDFQDTTEKDTEVTIEPGKEWTFMTMGCCPFSNNYVAEIEWAEIWSDHPIRDELWKSNDDNAFDTTQMAVFDKGYDYYPADENWHLALHHRANVFIV